MTFQTLLTLSSILWILLLLSITVLTISISSLIHWIKLRTVFNMQADQHTTEYIQQLEIGKEKAASNIRLALINLYWHCASEKQLPATMLENEVRRLAKLGIRHLGSRLKVLKVIMIIAPLIGLLGTVLGIIEVLQLMEQATEQTFSAILFDAARSALSATASGLVIATLTFVAYSYFKHKAQQATESIENDLALFLTVAATK